jgi:hypothetical protein
MGVIELLFYIVVICLFGAAASWVIRTYAAEYAGVGHKAILAIVVVSIVFLLLSAFGVIGYDPPVPQFFHSSHKVSVR